jgi:hypothetical protein
MLPNMTHHTRQQSKPPFGVLVAISAAAKVYMSADLGVNPGPPWLTVTHHNYQANGCIPWQGACDWIHLGGQYHTHNNLTDAHLH